MNLAVHYDRFDEVVVRRLVDGHHTSVTAGTADRAEAVRRLALAGYSDGQIAHRIGKRRRVVWRIRHRLGIPAAARGSNAASRPRPEAPARPWAAG